jgi:hypothetical protein
MVRGISVLTTILFILMSSCGQQIVIPTQGLMVSVPDQTPTEGGFIKTVTFLSNIGGEESHIEGLGGRTITEGSKPGTAPGISANKDIYVVTYWGGQPGFNHLHFFVSEKGQIWNRAGEDFTSGSSQIDSESRPSLTFFHPTRTWFVAFRDTSNIIQVAQFNIECTRDSRGDCEQEGRGSESITKFRISRTGNVINTGLNTLRAPTLSFRDNNLILAFVPAGSDSLSIATSSNGTTFSSPVAATVNGSPILCNAGAPYFHNSVGTLYLATPEIRTGGSTTASSNAVDIKISSSASPDGVNWTPVRTIDSGTGAAGGMVNPAIAGPESEMLVAFRTNGQSGTTVVRGSGGPSNFATETNEGVGLAWGLGPTQTARLSCGDPNLTVQSRTGDVPIPFGAKVTVHTSGDPAFKCGTPPTQMNVGCPSNTTQVDIKRGNTGDFTVACWR